MRDTAEHGAGPGWLVRRLDRLIPPELLREPESQIRSRVLVGSCFGLGALGGLAIIVRLLTVPFDVTPLVALGLIALVVALPWLQRLTRSHRIAGGVLVGAMIAAFAALHLLYGAFPGASLVLFPLVPVLGAFLVDVAFGALSAALIAVLAVLLRLLLPPPTGPQIAQLAWTFASVGAVAPLMCALVASAFDRARARSQLQLEAANARSEEAFARAEAANRSKTEFLRHVSHELRTPLSAILGYGELVQEELEEAGQDHISADVGRIRRASEQLLGLINDLLDISRIEAGAVDLEIAEVDLAALLAQVGETVRPLADANHNALEVLAPPDLPRVATDPRRLRQVLLNLASNACKFTERGHIALTAAPAPGGVVLRVRDTGVGMSPEQRARIFEPFVQVHPSAERRQQGTGLGLSLSRRLVEVLGGRIDVASEPGRGTEFSVHLPLSR